MDDNISYQLNVTNAVLLAGLGLVQLIEIEEEEERRAKRKTPEYRVRPYLKERNIKGRFATDFQDMRRDPEVFHDNFHMTDSHFNELYGLLESHLLPRRNSRPDDCIPPKAKLAVALEYMASHDLERHVASCYRISKTHLARIVDRVCDAICIVLVSEVPPWTQETTSLTANGFQNKWNFPNCVGAIDGKHVSLKAPRNSGSIFYNYKGLFSIVVLAVCDAKYKFTYLDVGAYGSECDSNIFTQSKFGASILADTCLFPEDSALNGKKIPHFLVADDAFPLCKRIMKPHNMKPLSPEQRIFNYRLSRARRCIENAFGILSMKWICLRKVMFCGPDRAKNLISASCLLHNFLMNRNGDAYCPNTLSGFEDSAGRWVEGEWRTSAHIADSLAATDLTTFHGRQSDYGKYIRNIITDYVNSEHGSVPWQNAAAFI